MLRCRPLLAVADHFFTTASLELRDDPNEWRAVAAFAGVDPAAIRRLHQVHGRAVVVARRDATDSWTPPQADAILSDDPSVALVVRVADCAPILIADQRLGVVAAVHAGWRSTMQRIVQAAVTSMADSFGSRPEELAVAIGPSLGSCCGEMGEEVVEAFRAERHNGADIARWFRRESGGRPHFDLWGANRDQLQEAGVPARSIHAAELCTKTYPSHFHSYRAAGQTAGRMAAVIRAQARAL